MKSVEFVIAVGINKFGGPEVLEMVEIPVRHPGRGEVRIRVHAASINPVDTLFRSGIHAAVLAHMPPPYVPGMDVAGIIDEIGDDATPWKVGDRVMAIVLPTGPGGGGYTESVVVPAESVALAPTTASFIEASTLPMNGLTARLVLDRLSLRSGATLAVTGAAGALGGYVVQLAKADGLQVIADASPSDESIVKGLGADFVVPRGANVAEHMRVVVPIGVDALVDGAVIGEQVVDAVRDGGAIAAVRPFDYRPARGIEIFLALVTDYARSQKKLDELRRLAEQGLVSLRVAGIFAPSAAGEAHRILEAGGTRGRLVIKF